MLLHQNKDDFKTLVSLASDFFGIRDYQVEKDYFVSLLLKKLSEQQSDIHLVFKGGTSLSKCYQLIDRFSEDVDLAVMTSGSGVSQGNRRGLKDLILSSIGQAGMEIINQEEVRSRRTTMPMKSNLAHHSHLEWKWFLISSLKRLLHINLIQQLRKKLLTLSQGTCSK